MKEFKITLENYLEAQKLFLGWRKWLFQIFFIGFFAIIIVFQSQAMQGGARVFYYVLMTVFAVGILLFSSRQMKKQFTKIYNSQKTFQESISVTFDDKQVEWKVNSGYFKQRWEDIYKYKYNDKIIIICESENLMRMIPITAFESNEEKESLLGYLKNTLGENGAKRTRK